MSATGYVFPDTNILLQCLDLSNIPWRDAPELASLDQIVILICHPVVMELDIHKYRTNDRPGRRARKYYSRLRKLIEGKAKHYTVRDRDPIVSVRICTDLQPKGNFLDYSITDNRILGCVRQYTDTRRKSAVFFLSHDMAAISTAQQEAIPYVFAPDDWRMAPEATDTQREVSRLTAEIASLRRAEPTFQSRLLAGEQQEIDAIVCECDVPTPLTEEQVVDLLDELQRGIRLGPGRLRRSTTPRSEDSTSKSVAAALLDSPHTHEALDLLARAVSRDPKAYREWIESCQDVFRNLHLAVQAQSPRLIFTFGVANIGTRPASDALITIAPHGPFRMSIPAKHDDKFDELDLQHGLKLPSPPERLGSLQFSSYPSYLASPLSTIDNRANRIPDAFYYKNGRSISPSESIVLECRQWRHGSQEELFQFALQVTSGESEVSGAVSCVIEAGNLRDPERLTVPVRLSVRPVSLVDHARKLVRNLIKEAASTR